MTQYISTVKLSSGEVEVEHDENASDEEIKKLALQKEKEAEYLRDFSVSETQTQDLLDQEPEEEDLAADLVQAVARPFTGFGGLAVDAVNLAGDLVGVDKDIISEDQSDSLKRAFIQRIGSVAGVSSDRVLTDDNEYRDTTTVTGDIATIAPYFIGGVGVAKGIATVAPKLPALVNGALSGLTLDQVLYQKGENTIAGDVFEPEGWEEGTFKDIVEFMSVDEDDSILEARVKLALEGLAIGGSLEGVMRGVKGLNNFRLNRSASVREQSEAAIQHLKESRQTAEVNKLNVHQDIKFSETPEGVAQIEQQNRGKFKYLHRFVNQIFKSRGYFTPSAYNAFRSKEYAERQLVREAENISTRLNKALDNLSINKVPDQQRLNNALTAKPEDLGFAPKATKEGKAKKIAADFKLPEEVAIEIVEARELIDGLSARLANSSIPNEEFKEIILENSGEYIRRSYRLFEDVNFKPDENLKLNVINRLSQSYQAANEALTENEAFELALGKVNKILNRRTDMAGLDHYAKAVKVNKEILTGQKVIDEDIRRLMGEITDPADNILLTVGKMARLVETNQFADNLLDMGKNKYIFDDAVERNGVDYGVKITGTNSGLDGKFTTQEMATAIAGRQSHFDIYDASLVRSYAQLKGTSQAMKTVGSHITHLRNVLGGAQFGLANGINPFFKAGETRQILANAIRNKGEAGLDGLYEEYLGLGVINTNVRIGEFRKLMQAGSELDGSPRQFFEGLKGYGAGRVAGKIYKGAEDLYMATDDFYKINAFERELKTLKKARPDASINDLKREAAEIVQNTLPNYDKVPPGVKSLRYLPIGSFVSFPAEILRTSTNIVKQSSKEIVEGLTTGNGALFQRGAQRLTGFTASMSAWKGMSVGAGMLAGLSQEEQDSIQKSSHTPWSKATRIPIRLEDGTLFVADTQFLDSYSTIKEPVEAVMHLIMEGQLKGDALDKYLGEAVGAFTETVLRPYVGQSIITEAITDIGFAYFDDAGRTPDGEQIFASNETTTQKAINAFTRIGDSMVPGTVSSAFKAMEIDDKRAATGTTKGDYRAELAVNLTGVRFTKLDPADKLFYSAKNYLSEKRTYLNSTPNYEMDAEEAVERKRKNLKSTYEAQQDLYLQFIAAEDLIGTDKAYEMLRQAGLSKNGVIALINNSYYDSTWADQNTENILKMPATTDEMQKAIEEVTDLQYKYRMTNLIPVDEDDRAQRADRLPRAKGGVVLDVPQVPVEPDERIDKMTGRPYNEQAGEAFTDEEDRIGTTRRLAVQAGGVTNRSQLGKKYNKDGERLYYWVPSGENASAFRSTGTDDDRYRRLFSPSSSKGAYYTEEQIRNSFDDDKGMKQLSSQVEWKNYWGYLTERQDMIDAGKLETGLDAFVDGREAARQQIKDLGGLKEAGGAKVAGRATSGTKTDTYRAAYADIVYGKAQQDLMEKYGIPQTKMQNDGSLYEFNGSSYTKTYKPETQNTFEKAVDAGVSFAIGKALGPIGSSIANKLRPEIGGPASNQQAPNLEANIRPEASAPAVEQKDKPFSNLESIVGGTKNTTTTKQQVTPQGTLPSSQRGDKEERVGRAKGGKIDKEKMACNKPKRTPNHPKKSHVVKACEKGKEKIIRYGEQGAETAGKPKAGESKRMKAKRKSFKARHGRNIRKGKMSAAYWADKSKW